MVACKNTNNCDITTLQVGENNGHTCQNTVMNEIGSASNRLVINAINQDLPPNTHQEYRDSDRGNSDIRQFFIPETQHPQPNTRKSKAVQVDHVEEQCITRRNTFNKKYLLCLNEMERPVFVNYYNAVDNLQHMFWEVGRNCSKYSDYSGFRSHYTQTRDNKHDKSSQSSSHWNVAVTRMQRMEETQQVSENYQPNQESLLVVQPTK